MWGKGPSTMVSIVVMAIVLIFIHGEFAAIVAPALLRGWLAAMAASILFLCLNIIMFVVPEWRARRSALYWVRMSQVMTILLCGGISASVWILLPPAGNALRMLAILLYFWFVAMMMMADGGRLAAAGCLALIASLAAFVIEYDIPYGRPIAGLLAIAGIAIVMLRTLIWRVADEALAARTLSEQAADALAQALAIVRAERDAKTRFIAAASHDLQQPIQAASLFTEQALASDDPMLRHRAKAGAARAFASVQALIETMLDHLRLDAGTIVAQPVEVAIDTLIDAVVLEHGPALLAAGLVVTPARSAIVTRADPRLMHRALGNLVGNAIRHAQGSRLLIGARLRDGRAELWVIDNGRGVAEGDGERIFEEFQQGSDHGLETRGGFGLGLSSVKGLMELQGGSIALDRRWRGGSAFVLRLPSGRRARQGAAVPRGRYRA